MSKSLYNTSSCGGCGCASKSLLNLDQAVSQASLNTTVNQFVSSQNQNPGSSNPSTGVNSVVDNLTVNQVLTVLQKAIIEAIETNKITIKGGSLTLQDNIISSNSSIILDPNNPAPCVGEVTIQDNLTVQGCYTNLCTTDTYIRDNVPSIGYCGTDPTLDNDDRGFEMRYADPTDIIPPLTQRIAFMGLDKDRFAVYGPRFAFWYDTFNFGTQNYQRTGSQPNGMDCDILYTYKITNPDDPNAPNTLAGLNKDSIELQATNRFDTQSTLQTHTVLQNLFYNVGPQEIHHTGVSTPPGSTIYRIDDNNDITHKFIEMTDDPTRFHGTVQSQGIFLFHKKIELNTKYAGLNDSVLIFSYNDFNATIDDQINLTAGNNITITAGPGDQVIIQPELAVDNIVAIIGGTAGTINVLSNLRLDNLKILSTDIINETSTNLTIQTTTGTNDIDLISAGDTTITSNGFLLTTVGTVNLWDIGIYLNSLTSHGIGFESTDDIVISANNIVYVRPGIEFEQQNTNPGVFNLTQTIYYGNNSGVGTTGLRTRFSGDEKLYLLSDIELSLGNRVTMYNGVSGHLVTESGLSTNLAGDLTVPGTLIASNPNNNVCADELIFEDSTNTLICVPISHTGIYQLTAGATVGRVMYANDAAPFEIRTSNTYTGAGTQFLSFDGTTMQWAASGAATTLQIAYDNSAPAPATITINNSIINNQIRIRHNAGYTSTLFEIVDDVANNYFSVSNPGGNKTIDFGTTISFTPTSATKIATFTGDINVTGVVDPSAIVLKGQIAPPPSAVSVSVLNDGIIYTDTISGSGKPYFRNGGAGANFPMLINGSTILGPVPSPNEIPAFIGTDRNQVYNTPVTIDSFGNMALIATIATLTNTFAAGAYLAGNEEVIHYNGGGGDSVDFSNPEVNGQRFIVINNSGGNLSLTSGAGITDASGNTTTVAATRSAIVVGVLGFGWFRIL